MRTLLSKAVAATALILGLLMLSSVPAAAQNARDRAKAAVDSGNFASAADLYAEALRQTPKDKDVLVEAADVNMELDRVIAARDLYARAYDIDDDDEALVRKYAAALSATKDHPRAVKLLSRAVKDDASLENYLALGAAYLAAGNDSLSRAELTFQLAAQKYPSSAEVRVALGDLYFARSVFELAIAKYEEAIALDKNLIEPRIHLGRAYREMGIREEGPDSIRIDFYNKSLLEFNHVTALAPRQPRPWIEQGEIFMLAHQYENAGRSFESYVALRPDDPRGDILLARAAYDGNFYRQAIVPLERIVNKSDSVSKAFGDRARYMLAKSYYATKDYAKAREAYAMVNDSLFELDGTKFYASSLLLSGGDTTKAIDLYRKLVAANPSDCDLSSALGSLMYSLKRYDDVIDIFTRRMAACPTAPKATPYLYIGLSHFVKGRLDVAIEALNNSIAADTTSVQAYYWLVNAYAKKEQWSKAADVARTMMARGFDKTNPKEVATGLFFGGFERFKAKDYSGAMAEFEKVIKVNPEYAQAYLYMAYCYQYKSDKDNACRYYRLTLKYDPKNAEAQKNMKSLGCS